MGPATERVQVRRQPDRASYDDDAVHAVLDEGLVGHLGIVDDGQPFVLPVGYARDGDRVLLHASTGSRLARLAATDPVCLTVTLLDGLVLARSAFHHSMDYRSVIILGQPQLIDDPYAKRAALHRLVEHLAPGQSTATRPPSGKELAATAVLTLGLAECSVKMRTGGPVDDDEDYALPIWAGVLPLTLTVGPLQADPANLAGLHPPEHLVHYRRPSKLRATEGATEG